MSENKNSNKNSFDNGFTIFIVILFIVFAIASCIDNSNKSNPALDSDGFLGYSDDFWEWWADQD